MFYVRLYFVLNKLAHPSIKSCIFMHISLSRDLVSISFIKIFEEIYNLIIFPYHSRLFPFPSRLPLAHRITQASRTFYWWSSCFNLQSLLMINLQQRSFMIGIVKLEHYSHMSTLYPIMTDIKKLVITHGRDFIVWDQMTKRPQEF